MFAILALTVDQILHATARLGKRRVDQLPRRVKKRSPPVLGKRLIYKDQ